METGEEGDQKPKGIIQLDLEEVVELERLKLEVDLEEMLELEMMGLEVHLEDAEKRLDDNDDQIEQAREV